MWLQVATEAGAASLLIEPETVRVVVSADCDRTHRCATDITLHAEGDDHCVAETVRD